MTGTAWPELAGVVDFALPPDLEATEPPEERGLGRDDVRLLVAHRASGTIDHRNFGDLVEVLDPGDALVVNTSVTLPASLEARVPGDIPAELHLSTEAPAGPAGRWLVELRHVKEGSTPPHHRPASTPWLDARPGWKLRLAEGGSAILLTPAVPSSGALGPVRLWEATLDLPRPLLPYLARHGRPIRYGYIDHDRPIAAYQTVFAGSTATGGSAEMPSAARPFSTDLVTRLASRGVVIAPFTLHTGVASPEAHEPPSSEWYRITRETAASINLARSLGHRVVAVGTTAVRALESVARPDGTVQAGEGWTSLVISPARGVRAVDGLLTGWHEPSASHLAMIEAVAGRSLTEASYHQALLRRYRWHEFGDSHLILP